MCERYVNACMCVNAHVCNYVFHMCRRVCECVYAHRNACAHVCEIV